MLPLTTPQDAVALIRSGDRVFLHGAAATPTPLIDALLARQDIQAVHAYHLHLHGSGRLGEPGTEGRVRSVSFFTGPSLRDAVAHGRADFMPVFLSDIPDLFRSRRVPLDVAVVQVSPPDRHGYCSLGTSCDAALAAVESAHHVIAEVNAQMPRTHGATALHMSRLHAAIQTDRPLPESVRCEPGPAERRIGEIIADLIQDGACLQMGIGAIPDAVLACLGHKQDLGVHTEMFSDGLVDLLLSGVVNNSRKAVHRGRTVTSFVTGTRRLYDLVDDNPLIEFHPCDRTNSSALIAKNDDVVAINSALEIDLSGQVCADSMGHRIFSGIGGQMDFIRAAALSRRGLPIIALPSTARGGTISRITTALQPGAGVVTTRGHVHWLVTEFGAVDLHGLTLRERAEALIAISHPDHRPELIRSLRNIRHFPLC